MTDVRSSIDSEVLKRNVGILVEALAADVYGLPKQAAEVLLGSTPFLHPFFLSVSASVHLIHGISLSLAQSGAPSPSFMSEGFPGLDSELISSKLDFISSTPRSQQMLDKDSQVINYKYSN